MSKEFIDEVNQELHDERLVGLWKRFGRYVVGGAILIVTVTVGITGYDKYTDSVAKSEALQFEQAVTGNIQSLDNLIVNGFTGTKLLSTIALASRNVADGDLFKATKLLQDYAKESNDAIYKNYALLASVWVGLEGGATANSLAVLDIVILSGHYKILAQFTKVEVLLGLGKNKEAKDILLSMTQDASLTSEQYKIVKISLSTLTDQ